LIHGARDATPLEVPVPHLRLGATDVFELGVQIRFDDGCDLLHGHEESPRLLQDGRRESASIEQGRCFDALWVFRRGQRRDALDEGGHAQNDAGTLRLRQVEKDAFSDFRKTGTRARSGRALQRHFDDAVEIRIGEIDADRNRRDCAIRIGIRVARVARNRHAILS
jgi:hypothetical protein